MKHLLLLLLCLSCASYQGLSQFKVQKNQFYAGNQEERQSADFYVPQGTGPFPGVILVHGGGWSSRHKGDMDSIAESLATHGFVVMNINYRFAPKFQHPTPIDDLAMALKYFKHEAQRLKLEPSKIGLWGYSSGAHTVSFYALSRAGVPSEKVQAVVAGGGPYDFTWYHHSPIIGPYMGGFFNEKREAYFEASPAWIVTPQAPPFFLYHGKQDKLLEYVQQTSFKARLMRAGVFVKSHKVGWWGHAMTFAWPNRPVEKGVKFLQEQLR